MKPLRIVVLMIEPPLPFGDAAARWFYVLLKGLVAHGHDVTAFAACSKPAQIETARDLFPAPRYDLRLFPVVPRAGLAAKWSTARRPFSYMFSPELQADFRKRLAGGFDVLHLEQLWSGYLGLGHADRALLNVHYLMRIDLGDDPATPALSKERLLGIPAERRLLRRFGRVRTLSPRLEQAVRSINPQAEVTAVPLGLDTTLYPFITDGRRGDAPTVTLIGSMAWGPGVTAARRLLTRLWPEIERRVPGARLQVVGWQARSALREFLDLPGVTVAENVPDARPYFEAASVLLYAPERGSGMKVKVLEAMAYGVPVVTNADGVEGLPAADGVHAGVCDDDAGLIDRAVALLKDPALRDRRRRAARGLVESWCDPDRTVEAVEAIYERILSGTRASAARVAPGRAFGL